jgi:hypothetical protein
MIDAYAREQSQAWTNLINNAVDAMCGSGTLRVTTRVENGEVVIEIGDTGPGIPDRCVRAFEASWRQDQHRLRAARDHIVRRASGSSVGAEVMAISGGRPGHLPDPPSPSLPASTRQSVTAVALKQAHGGHNQDRGPKSHHAAAPHDRSSQATPHFLPHAPAICGV